MKPSRIINPTLHTAAIAGLEHAVNAALQLDPSTQQQISQLDGHIFHFQCTAPQLDLYLMPSLQEIHFYGLYEGKADTTLTGSAEAFLKLATAADPASALINGDLELHGDSQALIQLQKIGNHIDLDWEAPLVRLFGDIVGHQLSEGIRTTVNFGLQALTSLQRQVKEYIVEESELIPARWQLNQFYNDVDQLAMRTERLQAKVSRLQQKITLNQ